MFKEWKAIFKKPTFIIVMIGISLIPALYNIIFLSSMWDPYGKLSELPVAIVNKDKEASYNGQTMTIGEDMKAKLVIIIRIKVLISWFAVNPIRWTPP